MSLCPGSTGASAFPRGARSQRSGLWTRRYAWNWSSVSSTAGRWTGTTRCGSNCGHSSCCRRRSPSYGGATVEVLEGLDGQLSVRHEGRIIAAQEAPPSPAFLRNGHELYKSLTLDTQNRRSGRPQGTFSLRPLYGNFIGISELEEKGAGNP